MFVFGFRSAIQHSKVLYTRPSEKKMASLARVKGISEIALQGGIRAATRFLNKSFREHNRYTQSLEGVGK